jgi:DNA repair protein RadC
LNPGLSESEKARERLITHRTDYLSNQELLIVLLSPGSRDISAVVNSLLSIYDGNLKALFTASVHQLTKAEGIGIVKACQIKAAFELGKRVNTYCKEERPQITSTEDVISLVAPHMIYLKQEEFRVLLLDSKNRVICYQRISLGSSSEALVYPSDVFRPAIAEGATSIILVHNHPSGDPEPSERDILLTRVLCICSRLVGIDILDHIIIGSSDCVSMNHRELM